MNSKHSFDFISSGQIETAAADWVVRRDSGLSEAERVEFARWQGADPRHAEAIARHEQAWSLLERPRAGGRTPELLRALPARIGRRRRRRVAAVMAAVTMVLLTCTAVWQTRDPFQEIAPGKTQVLMPRKQVLPDGSIVELKGETSIRVAYSNSSRLITLEGGEALFHVSKDPTRPFVVAAAGVEVRAIGTVFLVQLGGTQVDVIVTEGKVAVEMVANRVAPAAPGNASARPVEAPRFVEAGARLTVDTSMGPAASVPVAISATEIAARLGWRAPFLEFTDVPLTEAVALLNRHSPIPLVVDDPALAALAVNGRFRADNSETLARLLESSFGLTVEHREDQIILRKAKGSSAQD